MCKFHCKIIKSQGEWISYPHGLTLLLKSKLTSCWNKIRDLYNLSHVTNYKYKWTKSAELKKETTNIFEVL